MSDDANTKPVPLPLTFFDDLSDKPPPKPWEIKNVIARDETSSWIGPPGSGKSALFAEISVHKARAMDWRGYRVKERSGVVYFAMERADLTKRRLIAHRRRDNLGSLPIAVCNRIINLHDPNCVDTVLATIWDAEQRFACNVGLAIIDTYAKGIAAGGGDEDKAKDQNIALANLRRLFDRDWHGHIAGIGHTGKDESRGERGSNARLADVDVLVQISGTEIKTVTVKKANDQPEGPLTAFRLEPFSFGKDEDGDELRIFILSPETVTAEKQPRTKPSAKQTLALRALTEVTLSQGRSPPSEYQLPQSVKVVSVEAWREELFRANVIERDSKNPRARLNELRNGLATRFLIGSRDDVVWLGQKQ